MLFVIAKSHYNCKSMILPIMDYADIFCHNKSSKLLGKYQTIQNRCVRLISRIPRTVNIEEESKTLGLVPTAHRRALHMLQFALELPSSQPDLIETITPDQNLMARTRSRDPARTQFKMFKPNRTLIQNSISYQLRSIWNALPTSAHEMVDKHTLANHLLANPNLIFFLNNSKHLNSKQAALDFPSAQNKVY